MLRVLNLIYERPCNLTSKFKHNKMYLGSIVTNIHYLFVYNIFIYFLTKFHEIFYAIGCGNKEIVVIKTCTRIKKKLLLGDILFFKLK